MSDSNENPIPFNPLSLSGFDLVETASSLQQIFHTTLRFPGDEERIMLAVYQALSSWQKKMAKNGGTQ